MYLLQSYNFQSFYVCLLLSRVQLCDPMDYSLPGNSVHGILQARILESVSISFSRDFSQPRDQTQVSLIAGGFFTVWTTREALSLFIKAYNWIFYYPIFKLYFN